MTLYKTPLGRYSSDPDDLRHWNRLADGLASPGWTHHGIDDRYGVISFVSTDRNRFFMSPRSGSFATMHVEQALFLWEKIYGTPFTEDAAPETPLEKDKPPFPSPPAR